MASTVSLSGYASGIDTASIIKQLMAVESKPLSKLNAKKTAYQAQLTVYSDIRTKLSALSTAVEKLNTAREFKKTTVNSTDVDDEHFTVTASSSAEATTHTVKVKSLARASKDISQGFAATTSTIAGGTLKIRTGEDGEWTSITIDSSNNTLEGLRSAINSSGADVTASIMNDGDASNPYRLIITSKETGTANAVEIDTSGLSGTDPVMSFSISQTARDAQVEFDGVTITNSENKIENLVSGITIELKKIDTDNEYSVEVSTNIDGIKENIQDFVNKYNDVIKLLDDKTKADSSGIDSALTQIKRQLRTLISSQVVTSGEFTNMSQFGISTDSTGQLSIDDEELTDALTDHFDSVMNVMAANGSTTNASVRYSSSRAATQAGTYAVQITGVGSNLAGTIGGYSAHKSGTNMLVGDTGTPVEGLAVYFTGSSTGSYGSVTFSAGIMEKFDRLVDGYLNYSNGLLKNRENALNKKITDTDDAMTKMNDRLDKIEARYKAQYSKMELALSKLQTQGSYISGIS
ncbi:MAG: flagellar filament capping protein FliD [Myxococcales bacterium]|nr:flagellar filament capping protein FliD [Myxococcales bacterium]